MERNTPAGCHKLGPRNTAGDVDENGDLVGFCAFCGDDSMPLVEAFLSRIEPIPGRRAPRFYRCADTAHCARKRERLRSGLTADQAARLEAAMSSEFADDVGRREQLELVAAALRVRQ